MKYIINLTQHQLTEEQVQSLTDMGYSVLPVSEVGARKVRELITFNELPDLQEINQRAERLAELANYSAPVVDAVIIGGAPYFMGPLETECLFLGLEVFHAFSKRESVEETTPDGGVVKKSVFRHGGWIIKE